MTPDHIDALSTDAGATLAAIEDDRAAVRQAWAEDDGETVTLDEHIARMEETEDDGFITPRYYLSNECSD
jgi:hypothetical protein